MFVSNATSPLHFVVESDLFTWCSVLGKGTCTFFVGFIRVHYSVPTLRLRSRARKRPLEADATLSEAVVEGGKRGRKHQESGAAVNERKVIISSAMYSKGWTSLVVPAVDRLFSAPGFCRAFNFLTPSHRAFRTWTPPRPAPPLLQLLCPWVDGLSSGVSIFTDKVRRRVHRLLHSRRRPLPVTHPPGTGRLLSLMACPLRY